LDKSQLGERHKAPLPCIGLV